MKSALAACLLLCLALPAHVAAKPSNLGSIATYKFVDDRYAFGGGGMTDSVLKSIKPERRYIDRHGWRRKATKKREHSCVKPDGDWLDGVNRRQCKSKTLCRKNPFSGKRECGRWQPKATRAPLPVARPEMDEDQVAAYRVIAALFAGGKIIIKPAEPPVKSIFRGFAEELLKARGVTLKGVVSPLAHKAAELSAHCGARVISAVRHTYVAGTRRISLHSYGRAVDMAGNPACMYARLRGWPGGVSIDYARVRHVHISYDPPTKGHRGREWHTRFAHGGHKRRTRYARHRRQHYASAR